MLFNMPPYQISILYTTKYVSLIYIYIFLSSIYYFKATFRFVFTKSHKLFPSLKILLEMEKHTRYNFQKYIQSAWYLNVSFLAYRIYLYFGLVTRLISICYVYKPFHMVYEVIVIIFIFTVGIKFLCYLIGQTCCFCGSYPKTSRMYSVYYLLYK